MADGSQERDGRSPDAGREAEPKAMPSLAEKIDTLFKTVRPAKGGEYSYEQVAKAIREAGGPTISASYVWLLRKGERDNPTMHHLEALAKFFGVPPAYFFDEGRSEDVQEQLALLAILRDLDVRKVALRASGLSKESLTALTTMVEQARILEGLKGKPDQPEGDARDD